MINKNVENDFTNSVKQYYSELKECKPIPQEEENKLIKEAQDGNIQSRNKLINANLRFVFDVARKYRGKGLKMGDLISEGNIGLIKAIDKFDLSKNTKFITYAVYWIKEAILSALEDNNIKTYKEISIDNTFNDRPSCQQFITNSDDEVVSKKDLLFPDISPKGISIEDRRVLEMDNMLNSLGKTEKHVIQSLYGIGCSPLTFKDLGAELHVSSERIRQIKANGIKKMRAYALMSEKKDLFF